MRATDKVMLIASGGKEGEKKKKVKEYNVEAKKTGTIDVKSGSAADKLAQRYGNVVNFGGSASQKLAGGKSKGTKGINRNTFATKSTYGTIPKGYTGKFKGKDNKIYIAHPSSQKKMPRIGMLI
tara:strand:- start:98 stop:469 length:372 start_codon:yes stop_codon:yes gene_type:complete